MLAAGEDATFEGATPNTSHSGLVVTNGVFSGGIGQQVKFEYAVTSAGAAATVAAIIEVSDGTGFTGVSTSIGIASGVSTFTANGSAVIQMLPGRSVRLVIDVSDAGATILKNISSFQASRI